METQARRRRSLVAAPMVFAPVVIALILALSARPAQAHETDQFTLPPGREFADFGNYLNRFFHNAVVRGVEQQNNKIKSAVDRKGLEAEIKWLQSGEELAYTVNRQFPVALFLIEELDKITIADDIKPLYPGRIVGYKPKVGIRKNIDNTFNPFRAWMCATIYAYGVHFGTDKVGHFTDMGMHYYRGYVKARAAGKNEHDAAREALQIGTHGPIYSERGMLGLKTAGAYSNADLVANLMGMNFYRNLTEPVMLKGQQRPPMAVREGHYWKLAAHVRPDSDFFSWFVSDHFDEALNPSYYKRDLRPKMRDAIRDHRHETLARFTDSNGNVMPRDFFISKTRELSTYWGFDYGHHGEGERIITVADTCFAPAPDLSNPSARNDDGLSSVHWAAQSGDVSALKRLIAAGGDVNARVQHGKSVPFVAGDTPLHLAAGMGKVDAVKLLIERGADVNLTNARGVTPLHRAVTSPEAVAALCDAGARLDAADHIRRTPLHWAANDRQFGPAVRALLERKTPSNVADRDGLTPLHLAARTANVDAIVALAKAGADLAAGDRFGATPLHLAAEVFAADVAAMLLEAGAPVDSKDDFGVTPLLIATRVQDGRLIRHLLARGADPNEADVYGVSPVAFANHNGHKAVARLFADAAGSGDAAVTAGDAIAPGQ